MAYFAQLNSDNVVINVIRVQNSVIQDLPFPESEPIGVAFCQSLYGDDTIWKQTSYNANFRDLYAGIGYTYDPVLDIFVGQEPPPDPEKQEMLARTGVLPEAQPEVP